MGVSDTLVKPSSESPGAFQKEGSWEQPSSDTDLQKGKLRHGEVEELCQGGTEAESEGVSSPWKPSLFLPFP